MPANSENVDERKMDDSFLANQSDHDFDEESDKSPASNEIALLQSEFQTRLIAANLRTEAVRAGMVDLDGLKLMDLSGIHLDDSDKIIEGARIMSDLKRAKPWLFGAASTSSAAVAPASQPVRQKTAMDMTDEEYVTARNAVTKYHF